MFPIPTDKFISEGNVRIEHVKKSNEDYKTLKANIKEIGIITPITYRVNENGDYVVINGHQRLQIAKDLKLKEIPAYESNGKVDDLTKQLATNMLTVPMSHLDASFAIDQMVEKGIVTTKKALKAKFGKSTEWVDIAIAFCNIHPLIRGYFKENTLTDEGKEHLIKISKSTVTQQEIEISRLAETDEISQSDFNEHVEDYGWSEDDGMTAFLDELVRNLETDESKWEFVCKVIGKDTFREYETANDVVHEYQNTLFQEYADTQWCQEETFLAEVFLAETPIGHYIMDKDLPHNPNPQFGGGTMSFDFGTTLATLKKNLKQDAGVGLKNIAIEEWTGSVFNPRLSYAILEESQEPESYADEHEEEDDDHYNNETGKATNSDPHWLKYNKFNKWAAPIINKHLNNVDPLKCNKKGLNEVVWWLIETLNIHPSFQVGWNEEKHPLNEKYPLTNDDLIQNMAEHWFLKHFDSADFNELNVLLKLSNLDSCEEHLHTVFIEDRDGCRENYFKIFTKDDLVEHITNTHNVTGTDYGKLKKSELVDIASSLEWNKTQIPLFDLVCTNLGSGPNNIGNYLK